MNNNKGVLMFIAVFILTVLLSVRSYAANITIETVNEMGYPVVFDNENHTVNAGDVIFNIKCSNLKDGESLIYDDGGILSVLEDETYVMCAKDEGETASVDFFINGKNGMEKVTAKPFVVEFTDALKLMPKAKWAEGGDDEDPYVTISPQDNVETFLVVKDGEESVKRHITQDTRIQFADEGKYGIYAYTMDGRGNRTYSKSLPGSVTIDKTPPVIEDIDLDKPMPDDGVLYTRDKLTIDISAYDTLSGMEGIYIMADGMDPVKADTLTINPPYKGGVSFYARDRAGNETEKTQVVKTVIADNEPPVIEAANNGFENGTVKLTLSAADSLSGVEKLKAVCDGKTVFENDGRKEDFYLDIRNMEYGEKELFLTARDKAGNKRTASVFINKKDTTPPKISFYGAEDKGVYGTDTSVYVDVSDDSGKIASYSANVFVQDIDGKMVYSQTTDSRNIKITNSGTVTLNVEASDLESNTARAQISFAIDKDSPKIRGVDQYDGQVLEKFVLDCDREDMAEDLSLVTCDIYLNGLEYDGKEVSKDGKYVLKVNARDEFGNTSTKEADFTIKKKDEDKKPSVISVSAGTAEQKKKAGLSKNSVKTPQKTVSGSGSGNHIMKKGAGDKNNTKSDDGFLGAIKYAIIKMFGLRNGEATI